MIGKLCSVALTVAMLVVARPSVGAVAEITLRDRAEISGPVLRLADVADVVSADRELVRRLAALPLMPAPAPGTQRYLRKRELEDLLAAHGMNLSELRFAGVEQVTIAAAGEATPDREVASTAAGQTHRHAAVLAGRIDRPSSPTLTAAQAEELRDEYRRLIIEHLNNKTNLAAAWDIDFDVSDHHLALLDAATTPTVCQGGNAPWTGRQRFVVSFHTAEGHVQVPIVAEIAANSAPVAVAIRPVARGDVITAAHVELRSVDYIPRSTDRRSPVDAVEQLYGMEARQAIGAGDVVFTDQVQPPLLVKRGEQITVVSASGGIRVRTTARARQDGSQGALVQVESLETRERYDARVTGTREVAVFAPTTPALQPSGQIETARR